MKRAHALTISVALTLLLSLGIIAFNTMSTQSVGNESMASLPTQSSKVVDTSQTNSAVGPLTVTQTAPENSSLSPTESSGASQIGETREHDGNEGDDDD